MSDRNKVLSSIIGVFIVAVIAAIAYVSTYPPEEERFTEFSILGLTDKAENYPEELMIGEEGKVILEIVNHEHQEMHYRALLEIEGIPGKEISSIVLKHEERWQQEVGFIPQTIGENKKVELLLFKQGQDEPYRSLYLLVDVIARG